jgi:hypothetical protein
MGPESFEAFFATSAGVGATLVGLLFVAISIAPERVFGKEARAEHQLIASSAFTALVNAFFISLGALIPSSTSTAAGTVVLVMGCIALLNSAATLLNLGRQSGLMEMIRSSRQSVWLLLVGIALYGCEVWNAAALVRAPTNTAPLYTICALLVAVYGFGIVRAWQLLGADRRGFISFLIPLLLPAQHRHSEVASAAESPAVESRATVVDTQPAAENR